MKKTILRFATAMLLLTIGAFINLNAQVTVGSNKAPDVFSVLELISTGNNSGLRLTQMTTAQRDAMANATFIANPLSVGLVIYNTTTNCVEYWNGTRWIGLCEGSSPMVISPAPCAAINADGTGCDEVFTLTDPDCPTGPFSFAIVVGSDFASFASTSSDGNFSLSFMPNSSVNPRSIIVRVTSDCSGLFKDFLFTQNGQDCGSTGLGNAPSITAVPAAVSNAVTLCSGGAVYLYVPASTANLDQLIWTRNGVEFARGVSGISVTQSGRYDVFMGFIGCGQVTDNYVDVTISGSTTTSVAVVVSENGGVICDGGNIKLTALGSPANIVWFKDGVLQPALNNQAQITLVAADAGSWTAAVGDGSCYSLPSAAIDVSVSSTLSGQVTLNPADVKVNGVAIGSVTSFCPGSSLILSVDNQVAGITYQWYNGNVPITSPYNVPADATSMLLRLVASDNSNTQCPAETNSTERTITGSTPATPTISGATILCSGGNIDLTATSVAGAQYEWFLNGVSMGALSSNNFININSAGSYQVRIYNNGCYSALSAPRVVTLHGVPSVTWLGGIQPPANSPAGTYPFSVVSAGNPSSWTWSADPSTAASISGTGESVSITFTASATISVFPSNNCGDGGTISYTVTVPVVITDLPTPIVTPDGTGTTSFCNSVNFTITRPSGWTDAQWLGLTASNILATYNGAHISGTFSNNGAPAATRVYYYSINATSATPLPVTFNFRGQVGGLDIAPFSPAISGITIRTDVTGTPVLSGETCFDIAYVNEGISCGTLATRNVAGIKADFSRSYAYSLSGTLSGITSVVWSYSVDYGGTTASNAVTGWTPAAFSTTLTSNKVDVTFNPALLTNNSLGEFGINVTITATITTSGGACGTAVYVVTQVVNIRDCACCGCNGTAIPQQIGTKQYLTHYFITDGENRCWMVENLAEIPSGTTSANPAGAGSTTASQYWTTYSGQAAGARGWYYNHPAALNACPAGWSLPTQSQLQGTSNTGTNGIFTQLSNTATVGRTLWFNSASMAGNRATSGTWTNWGSNGFCWSSTSGSYLNAYSSGAFYRYTGGSAAYGFSVRCIQNK